MCYDDNLNDPRFPWEIGDEPVQRGYAPDNYSGQLKWKAKGALEGIARALYTPFSVRTSVTQIQADNREMRHPFSAVPEFYDYRSLAHRLGGLVAGFSGLAAAAQYGILKETLVVLAVTNLIDLVRPRGKYKLP